MSASVAHEVIQKSLVGEAVEGGPVAVFVADHDGKYIAVNDYACRLLGYTREELLALSVTDVAVDENAAADYDELLRGRRGTGRSVLRTKDGRDVPVSFRASSTTVGGLELFVGICWPDGEG
ncbi:MAG TPA: PAS domain-containing protein [Gaiellaceae bacterium]|nr:PAS domain-containing protein [Gaiellaceae bacterium]